MYDSPPPTHTHTQTLLIFYDLTKHYTYYKATHCVLEPRSTHSQYHFPIKTSSGHYALVIFYHLFLFG